MQLDTTLGHKFAKFGDGLRVQDGLVIEGYASLFGACDQGGDVVGKGAYARSLTTLAGAGRAVKMLWQHDPAQPIGVWDEVREDAKGLWVKGRLLDAITKGREAAALIEAGAIDGLSIGYRTLRASKNDKGQRLLQELELWEVSLVTFPMLPSARVAANVAAKSEEIVTSEDEELRAMATALDGLSAALARP